LEKIIDAAYAQGINHFETARGYGTSEVQLGSALKRLPREKIIIQTKIPPKETAEEFEETLKLSYSNLKIDYANLIAIHGINSAISAETSMPCLDVLERWKKQGRLGHIGFSTHADDETVLKMIATDRFDYVNLHYYYIFQKNAEAVEAARKQDMGVFIISPNDKGGRLYSPPDKLRALTAPFTPMQFNDLFCLSNPGVQTLSVGTAKPADFDEHLEILEFLNDDGSLLSETSAKIAETIKRLNNAMTDALGADWLEHSQKKLPVWSETPGNINIPVTLRMWNLAKGLDMIEYAKMRYNLLGKGGHWFPGESAAKTAKFASELEATLTSSNSPFPDRIIATLKEAHTLLAE
jgi:predicted aldo/keto reductase-like oxidoreductase